MIEHVPLGRPCTPDVLEDIVRDLCPGMRFLESSWQLRVPLFLVLASTITLLGDHAHVSILLLIKLLVPFVMWS